MTGPRQAGKTTLCRALFPRHRYVSLEAPDTREYALSDPRGFLAELAKGAVIDEVQRAPALLSYLQEEVDARPRPGRFVLTGSANLGLLAGVSQTLAGRTGLLTLLPFSHDELRGFENAPRDRDSTLWSGAFPAVFDRRIPVSEWFSAYLATYVERDVRQILNVTDLQAFQSFVRLCAGRVGQLVNLASLGSDCGITHNTARAWLSVLEASYVVLRLPPWHANLGKRLDQDAEALLRRLGPAVRPARHPRGRTDRRAPAAGGDLRELGRDGDPEVADPPRPPRGPPLLPEPGRARGGCRRGVGSDPARRRDQGRPTIAADFFESLEELRSLLALARPPRNVRARLVYGGESGQKRTGVEVVPWNRVADTLWVTRREADWRKFSISIRSALAPVCFT